MRKVFLEELPKWGKGGKGNEGSINWGESAKLKSKVKFMYDDIEGEIEIIDYTRKGQKLKVNYKNENFSINTHSFKECKLGILLGKKSNEFKFEIGTSFKDNDRDLIIIDREYRDEIDNSIKGKDEYIRKRKYYKCKCNNCKNEENWIREADLVRGQRCVSCSGINRQTIRSKRKPVLGVSTIYDTDRWMCDLGLSEEDAKTNTSGSGKIVTVKCPTCGEEKECKIGDIYRRKSIGCICGDGFSYPEKLMYSILKQLNLEFETQYSPNYLIPKEGKRYRKFSDFYLPNFNLVIEADGGLGHKGGKQHSKSNKTLEESIAIDKWKDEQHLKNGVKTIRINCFESNLEYIKSNILDSELSKMFNLSNIDWVIADLYAIRNNKVKDVCEYWNVKDYWESTTDLAKIFNVSSKTIREYLEIGMKLNWVHYDKDEERRKVGKKNK